MEDTVRPLSKMSDSDISQAMRLQGEVFHREQLFLDVVIQSFALCEGVMAYGIFRGDIMVGYCQYRQLPSRALILERVCVNIYVRNQGVGLHLIERSIEDVQDKGWRRIELKSQIQCVGFYAKIGFIRDRDEMYLGRPHVSMYKDL